MLSPEMSEVLRQAMAQTILGIIGVATTAVISIIAMARVIWGPAKIDTEELQKTSESS